MTSSTSTATRQGAAKPPRRRLASLLGASAVLVAALGSATPAWAQMPPPPPSKPAVQYQSRVSLTGINAIQLAWWFQHLADSETDHWKALAPASNRSISWVVNPREDAHQLIGSSFVAQQHVAGAGFKNDLLTVRAQFGDYVTQQRSYQQGQPAALNPTPPLPSGYKPPYPSYVQGSQPVNGFNQNLIISDDAGYNIGNVLWSWKNTGSDDTASSGGGRSIDLVVTFLLPWMEGPNRPLTQANDGYVYNAAQVAAIWSVWQPMLKALPSNLPRWFDAATQDDAARQKGWTMTAIVDTGHTKGLTSEMQYWWWNHAMGDEPGDLYQFWCPTAHHGVHWLKGYSPADILRSQRIPRDAVVPGTIYPDLQHTGTTYDGGGMMAYPKSMSPVPGVYEHLALMYPVSKAQVDNFATARYPAQSRYLMHQWEDTPKGLVHRASFVAKLPLAEAVSQSDFYQEHMLLEGQFHASGAVQKALRLWKDRNPGHDHEYHHGDND